MFYICDSNFIPITQNILLTDVEQIKESLTIITPVVTSNMDNIQRIANRNIRFKISGIGYTDNVSSVASIKAQLTALNGTVGKINLDTYSLPIFYYNLKSEEVNNEPMIFKFTFEGVEVK